MVQDLNICGVNHTQYDLNSLLTARQLDSIIDRWTKNRPYSIEKWVLTKASKGLAGYIGDHLRLKIIIDSDGKKEYLQLFIKCLPNYNQPKVEFIKKHMFYERENFVLNELLKDAGGCEGQNQWRPQVFVCNEEIVLMLDLAVFGYTVIDRELCFDLQHCTLTIEALAKYHAASVNYETRKTKLFGNGYRISDEFSDILAELTIKDNPWLRAGAKMTSNFLGAFSKKYNDKSVHHKNIEAKLQETYIKACDSINADADGVNVVIHKDLWSNNIMFKYVSGKPVSAALVDFQSVRYAPPAFDVSLFLYLNTNRSFRKVHESDILKKYYETFLRELSTESTDRLKEYSFEEFLHVFEKSRMFGLLIPVLILPYVSMEPIAAKKCFDDSETYERYNNEDRTEPVVSFARENARYRDKVLEVSEEFVEKFVLCDPPFLPCFNK